MVFCVKFQSEIWISNQNIPLYDNNWTGCDWNFTFYPYLIYLFFLFKMVLRWIFSLYSNFVKYQTGKAHKFKFCLKKKQYIKLAKIYIVMFNCLNEGKLYLGRAIKISYKIISYLWKTKIPLIIIQRMINFYPISEPI